MAKDVHGMNAAAQELADLNTAHQDLADDIAKYRPTPVPSQPTPRPHRPSRRSRAAPASRPSSRSRDHHPGTDTARLTPGRAHALMASGPARTPTHHRANTHEAERSIDWRAVMVPPRPPSSAVLPGSVRTTNDQPAPPPRTAVAGTISTPPRQSSTYFYVDDQVTSAVTATGTHSGARKHTVTTQQPLPRRHIYAGDRAQVGAPIMQDSRAPSLRSRAWKIDKSRAKNRLSRRSAHSSRSCIRCEHRH